MKKLLKNKKGFTLIELIVVIAILAILAAILVPSITNYISSAQDAKDEANARAAFSEAALYFGTTDDASPSWTAPVNACGTTTAITALSSFSCNGYDAADFELS